MFNMLSKSNRIRILTQAILTILACGNIRGHGPLNFDNVDLRSSGNSVNKFINTKQLRETIDFRHFLKSTKKSGDGRIQSYGGECAMEVVLYEDAIGSFPMLDFYLQKYSVVDSRLYEDESLTVPSTMSINAACTIFIPCLLGDGDTCIDYAACNYFLKEDYSGTILTFSGDGKIMFSGDDKDDAPIGSGDFVILGGAGKLAGAIGKVFTTYGATNVRHAICIQDTMTV